ncbi:MAG: hypothetical protein IPL62_12760 [Caulobacteraceae bacterium]|nr:hypothetical protein [Caulobacteraceae bacterium]
MGADTMNGGEGDDTHIVDNAADVVTEDAGQGTDTVRTAMSFTLGANFEGLVLLGAAVVNATGNALNNTLTGNVGANIPDGGAGADTMIGGDGDDIISLITSATW